jgi:hypothetical protein
MKPSEVSLHIGGMVNVDNPKIGGRMLFTAYIFRFKGGKKIYQAEVQNPDPPHEIYIVSLDDLTNT